MSRININNFFDSKLFQIFSLIIITCIVYILYIKHYYSYVFLAASTLFGLLVFIYVQNKFTITNLNQINPTFPKEGFNRRHILSISFFVCYCMSILTLIDGHYTKTIWYYIFISICAGIIACSIIFLDARIYWASILFETTLLFLNLSLSNQIVYTLGIGNPDNFFHLNSIILPIISSGKIPYGYSYTYFPMHHILASIVSLFTNVSPLIAYHFSGSLLMSAGPIYIFLIGRLMADNRLALFSSLLYCCCDYTIYWGSHPVQLSYMYPVMLIAFTLILYIIQKRTVGYSILFLIISIYLNLLHHYSVIIMSFILVVFAIIEIWASATKKEYDYKTLRLIGIFYLILLTQWMFYSKMFGKLVNVITLYTNLFNEDFTQNIIHKTFYDSMPIKIILINQVGSCLLLFVSIIGLYYLLKKRSFIGNIFCLLFFLLISLIAVGTTINIFYLMPNRIYVYLQQFVLVFLASIALVWVLNNKNNRKIKYCVVIFIIMLQFFSAASTIAGFETSPFVGAQPFWKIYETPSEKNSLQWLEQNKFRNSTIYINPGFVSSKDISYEKYKLISINNESMVDSTNISNNAYFFYSDFDVLFGFVYQKVMRTSNVGSSSKIKLNSSAKEVIDNSFTILDIYDNGHMDLYYKIFTNF